MIRDHAEFEEGRTHMSVRALPATDAPARLQAHGPPVRLPDYWGPQAWLFSGKTFAAARLALFIALSLDFSQPGWSITKIYVVSQPLSGMVLSKASFRALGTIAGAIASLILVSLSAQAQEPRNSIRIAMSPMSRQFQNLSDDLAWRNERSSGGLAQNPACFMKICQ
jgi:hypothetical protein